MVDIITLFNLQLFVTIHLLSASSSNNYLTFRLKCLQKTHKILPTHQASGTWTITVYFPQDMVETGPNGHLFAIALSYVYSLFLLNPQVTKNNYTEVFHCYNSAPFII